jgi:hypothetical protein
MNRSEMLEMMRETKEKLSQIFGGLSQYRLQNFEIYARDKVYDAQIWIDRFSSVYGEVTTVEIPHVEDVVDVESIHNNDGRVAYKVNYLKSIAERLARYAKNTTDPFCLHCLMKAIDYIYEAIGYLEQTKGN